MIKWLLRYLLPFSKVLNGTIQLCIIFRFDQLADKRRERNAPVLHSLKNKHILTEEAVETGFVRHRMIKQRQAALRKALLILLDDRCQGLYRLQHLPVAFLTCVWLRRWANDHCINAAPATITQNIAHIRKNRIADISRKIIHHEAADSQGLFRVFP